MTPRFVCIDTETTGLGNDARVLELGMVFSEDGQVVDSWCQRFYPKGVIWDSPSVLGAYGVHGIAEHHLIGCPDFSAVVDTIDMFLGRYSIIVGHNVKYDLRMLSNEYARAGRTLPTKDAFVVCTKELGVHFDRLENKKTSHKLVDTAARFGVKLADAHTAVGDATATAEVFLRMEASNRLPLAYRSTFDRMLKDRTCPTQI